MNDANWKTWALIFVLSVGCAIELLKRMPQQNGEIWDRENLQFTQDGRQQPTWRDRLPSFLGQRRSPKASNRQRPSKVAAMANVTRADLKKFVAQQPIVPAQETTFDGAKKTDPKLEKKKKTAKSDECEFYTDPKTNKKMKRCKKKVAKVEGTVDKIMNQSTDTKSLDKTDENEIDAAITESITSGVVTAPPAKADDNQFKAADEWIRRLLNRPDLNETKRFIDQYQRSLVAADVFYKVIHLMLEDSRPEMRKLGVLAAGLTPSVMSFQTLSEFHKGERELTVLAAANQYIAAYRDIGNLYVIERILKASGASYTTFLAARTLEDSATVLLKIPTGPSANPAALNTQKRNAKYFQRFIEILQPLTVGGDVAVRDQATRTLASLQSLLNNSNTPSATPPTVPTGPQAPTNNPNTVATTQPG